MYNSYYELIEQTFYFPQENFRLGEQGLFFNGVPMMPLIEKYGTPFKVTYLPKISSQIEKARRLFQRAMDKINYDGKYHYCYCTKSNHFKFVLDEVLKQQVYLETSSSFDMDLVKRLLDSGKINKQTLLINNGFKPKEYLQKIAAWINGGFTQVLPILDNKEELKILKALVEVDKCKIGLRIATEEEPTFEFYTSRLGIRKSEVIDYYKEQIQPDPNFELEMIHFFVDTGIKDSLYYWSEFKRCIRIYCELSKICPSLKSINIGGGMPVQNSLGFEYDYAYMIEEIVLQIQLACKEFEVPTPDIYTEFGKYTVGESSANIFGVIGHKEQNDRELWYMIDSSLMTTMPDVWGLQERFVLLPINKWHHQFRQINLGGLSCDNSDYYNSEVHVNQVFLPKYDFHKEEPLYLGFFHTGAYQDALSGVGGIKHCLIPSPKHVIVTQNEDGEISDYLYHAEQDVSTMLNLLGYD